MVVIVASNEIVARKVNRSGILDINLNGYQIRTGEQRRRLGFEANVGSCRRDKTGACLNYFDNDMKYITGSSSTLPEYMDCGRLERCKHPRAWL